MILRQVTHDDLGCASYLIGDDDAGVAAVVDPRLDIDEYLRLARYLGVSIEHVLETHTHADHVSGHSRLAAATGAVIHIHREAGADYAHEPFDDGWELALGALRVRALHTPGHRPEHTAFVLTDTARGPEPWAVLTGDSLFVGDIARPDLAVDREEGARGVFGSLRSLLALPGFDRGVAGASRRVAVRRARDGHEGRLHGRVRAGAQRTARGGGRGRVRAVGAGVAGAAAAELPRDRGAQPRRRDGRAPRRPAADAAPGRAQARGGRAARRHPHGPAVRRRARRRRDRDHRAAGRLRLQARLARRPRAGGRARSAATTPTPSTPPTSPPPSASPASAATSPAA